MNRFLTGCAVVVLVCGFVTLLTPAWPLATVNFAGAAVLIHFAAESDR